MSDKDRAAFILNSDKPVAIHHYPKEWRSPFMAGFGFTIGAGCAVSAMTLIAKLLHLVVWWVV